MSRNQGAIKGVAVFVNDDTSESTQLILEPLHLADAQYTAMLAGGSFSAAVSSDTALTNIKYVTPTNGTVDTVTITGSYIGVGNNVNVTFTKTFTETPIKLSTFTVTAGAVTGTSNSSGVISGTGITSGSITAQGAFTITFTAAVSTGTPITATFTRGV